MHSQDVDVLTQLKCWLDAEQAPWLCTVVSTTGSSPRPPGSLLAFHAGQQVGSLSGGCVEDDLLSKLTAGEILVNSPTLYRYGLNPEDNERLGLPCGGSMQILVEQLSATRGVWVGHVLSGIRKRQRLMRALCMTSGESTLSATSNYDPIRLDDKVMHQCFGPRMRLLLVGAGQLAHTLSSLALAMDFDVIVTDPRESLINDWQGPDIPRLVGLPDDIILQQGSDAHTAIITLTHDPRIDDMALLEALETDAWYVGALGSVRTSEARRARLRQLGLSEQAIGRLHAPVGLPIGSKTPWEIAVAIMAELTQERHHNTAGGISARNR